jgi:hypothetical protein
MVSMSHGEKMANQWRQFSLSRLLLFVAVAAVLLGLFRIAWRLASEWDLQTDYTLLIAIAIPFSCGILAGLYSRAIGASKASAVLMGVIIAIGLGILVSLQIPSIT